MRADTPKVQAVPGRCPGCEAVLCLEPTKATGEVPCPYCGRALWFLRFYHRRPEMHYYVAEDVSPRKRAAILKACGRWVTLEDPGGWARMHLDSLGLVEFILELEGDLGPKGVEQGLEKFPRELTSFGEFLDWVIYDWPE
jgi:hypothetical protein